MTFSRTGSRLKLVLILNCEVNHSSGNSTVKAAYITSVLFFCAYPLPNSLKLHDDVLIFLSRHGSLQSNLTVLLNEAEMNPLNNEELIMNGWLCAMQWECRAKVRLFRRVACNYLIKDFVSFCISFKVNWAVLL